MLLFIFTIQFKKGIYWTVAKHKNHCVDFIPWILQKPDSAAGAFIFCCPLVVTLLASLSSLMGIPGTNTAGMHLFYSFFCFWMFLRPINLVIFI